MSTCPAQLFENITQPQFDCLSEKAKASGIDIAGNTGSTTQLGMTVEWTFDPAAATLSIQCTSAPVFAPCSIINSQIRGLVETCLA